MRFSSPGVFSKRGRRSQAPSFPKGYFLKTRTRILTTCRELEALESQWQKDMERRLADNEAEAIRVVAERAERRRREDSETAEALLQERLASQREELQREAEMEAARTKAE